MKRRAHSADSLKTCQLGAFNGGTKRFCSKLIPADGAVTEQMH